VFTEHLEHPEYPPLHKSDFKNNISGYWARYKLP